MAEISTEETTIEAEEFISGSIEETTIENGELIYAVMKKVCTGMYAKKIPWIGYSNGTVTIKDFVMYVPVAGTSDSDCNICNLEHHFPDRKDLWAVMYEGLMVFIRTESDNPLVATILAKETIVKDIKENKIIMRDL